LNRLKRASHSGNAARRAILQGMDVYTLVAVLVVWFVLQTWVLPRFGVPT
jgi:hypothetical protein